MKRPAHHKLKAFLDEYLAAAQIAADKDGPLFRTTGRATGYRAAWYRRRPIR